VEALGINVPVLLAQLANFTLLLGLLYLILYKPILRVMDERSARIKESLEQAEFIREETARTQERIQEQLAAARQEGQAIVAQATQMGERLKEEARGEARREAEAIIVRARLEIQAERDEAIVQLRQQVADLAVLAAERLINRTLDREAHRRLIEEILEEATGPKRG